MSLSLCRCLSCLVLLWKDLLEVWQLGSVGRKEGESGQDPTLWYVEEPKGTRGKWQGKEGENRYNVHGHMVRNEGLCKALAGVA